MFLPAALLAVRVLYRKDTQAARLFALAALLLNPAHILIDHGHFQYNCISLGLAMAAAASICAGRQLVGSFLFCLSLNHKQMSLFYAPAFFAHLLGWALHRPGFLRKVRR